MTGSKKILIIEDYADIASVYKYMLESNGFTVEVAKDGEEALLKILNIEPNVIFLDIMLPKMDGLTVLSTIRSDSRFSQIHPRVLVLSNLQQQDVTDKSKLEGADGFVVKANLRNMELVTIAESLCAKYEAAAAGDTSPYAINNEATPSVEAIQLDDLSHATQPEGSPTAAAAEAPADPTTTSVE